MRLRGVWKEFDGTFQEYLDERRWRSFPREDPGPGPHLLQPYPQEVQQWVPHEAGHFLDEASEPLHVPHEAPFDVASTVQTHDPGGGTEPRALERTFPSEGESSSGPCGFVLLYALPGSPGLWLVDDEDGSDEEENDGGGGWRRREWREYWGNQPYALSVEHDDADREWAGE